MSNMKGFSTLNRWFGKKQKDKNVGSANGKLSKSTTQLHHMSTDSGMHCININDASQLEYNNRITPLPAATSNAPFEQTFRITVLLPKDQLYVTRLGARVPLQKLLSLVCDNKQLDDDKYEFRNPVDASQVFSCESTIGAVGLSEIRLCHKSESYDSFNADTMIKFHRTNAVRDSLSSSSDFSSSHSKLSKLTMKTGQTPSPYSSSNSLNSMDSTGMNYTRTPVLVPSPKAQPPPLAVAPPPRKKRLAPRPPSQLVIPEQSVAPNPTEPFEPLEPLEPAYAVIVKRRQLCVSTPNLVAAAATPAAEVDCNGNSAKLDVSDGHYASVEVRRDSSAGTMEAPTPRKRLLQLKKKAAPPAPPLDDTISLAESNDNSNETAAAIADTPLNETPALEPPQPAPRITTPTPTLTPTPTPTLSTVNAATPPPPPLPMTAAPHFNESYSTNTNNNVSKVLLNRTPTPEPRQSAANGIAEDDNEVAAKSQTDSDIAEPIAAAIAIAIATSPEPQLHMKLELEEPLSLHSEPELKSNCESSSEDDEAIKVYNFKLCRTSVKAEPESETKVEFLESKPKEVALPTTLAALTELARAADCEDDGEGEGEGESLTTPCSVGSEEQTSSLSSWNYAVPPISPPPDFSDQQKEQEVQLQLKQQTVKAQPNPQLESQPSPSPSSSLAEIMDELSTIINEQRMDTFLSKQQAAARSSETIESAKPNKLANFSIAAIATSKTTTTSGSNFNSTSSSNSTSTSRISITRADSFQAPTKPAGGADGVGLGLRSSSHLSLTKIEQISSLHQRRSSSELSIGESPSLQSLEVIKTILNSRKNSLNESSPQLEVEQQPLYLKLDLELAPEQQTAKSPKSKQPAEVKEERAIEPATIPTPTPTPTPEATPPTYRYSGPPNINFSTWSERPKSQVAIKNEGDYIFGNRQSLVIDKQQPSSPSHVPSPTSGGKLTIEAAAPILRMGIGVSKKYNKVPITVKPLRDGDAVVAESQAELAAKPSTLPRPAKGQPNRYTLPASTLATMSTSTSTCSSTTTTTTNSLPRPSSMQVPAAQQTAAPFGQNTLRRTGFKERMLAKEQQEKEKVLNVTVNGTSASKSTPMLHPQPAKAIIELKPSQPLPAPAPAPAPKPKPASVKLQIKLRPTSTQATPTSTSTPTPTPPPPPAPPLAVLKKSQTSRSAVSSPTSADPRSQLLDAIRNFKRDELNCA